jgi:hypothetical protein
LLGFLIKENVNINVANRINYKITEVIEKLDEYIKDHNS